MESLSKNWITEKYVDFELKKYMLLGYLQHVSKHFDAIKLYPHLSELIMHYKNVVELKDNKNALYESFSERLLGADIKEFKLLYEKILHDEPLMKELESIIDFSIPQFEKHMQAGKKGSASGYWHVVSRQCIIRLAYGRTKCGFPIKDVYRYDSSATPASCQRMY